MISTKLMNIIKSANPAMTKDVNWPLDSTVTDPRTSINSYFMLIYEIYARETCFPVLVVLRVEFLVIFDVIFPVVTGMSCMTTPNCEVVV